MPSFRHAVVFVAVFALHCAVVQGTAFMYPNYPMHVNGTTVMGVELNITVSLDATRGRGPAEGLSCYIHWGKSDATFATWSDLPELPIRYLCDTPDGMSDIFRGNLNQAAQGLAAGFYLVTGRCSYADASIWVGQDKLNLAVSIYTAPRCGNGVRDPASALGPAEDCDIAIDANCRNCKCPAGAPLNAALKACSPCGNSKRDGDEECEVAGQGCLANCTCNSALGWTLDSDKDSIDCSKCGNGRLDAGEQCDSSPSCLSTCFCLGDYTPDSKGFCLKAGGGDSKTNVLAIAVSVSCAGAFVIVVFIAIVILLWVVKSRGQQQPDVNHPVEMADSGVNCIPVAEDASPAHTDSSGNPVLITSLGSAPPSAILYDANGKPMPVMLVGGTPVLSSTGAQQQSFAATGVYDMGYPQAATALPPPTLSSHSSGPATGPVYLCRSGASSEATPPVFTEAPASTVFSSTSLALSTR
eukprot:m51a1_g6983 putative protein tyrosine kinase domain containing protein (469) ;mRNA; r:144111-146107